MEQKSIENNEEQFALRDEWCTNASLVNANPERVHGIGSVNKYNREKMKNTNTDEAFYYNYPYEAYDRIPFTSLVNGRHLFYEVKDQLRKMRKEVEAREEDWTVDRQWDKLNIFGYVGQDPKNGELLFMNSDDSAELGELNMWQYTMGVVGIKVKPESYEQCSICMRHWSGEAGYPLAEDRQHLAMEGEKLGQKFTMYAYVLAFTDGRDLPGGLSWDQEIEESWREIGRQPQITQKRTLVCNICVADNECMNITESQDSNVIILSWSEVKLMLEKCEPQMFNLYGRRVSTPLDYNMRTLHYIYSKKRGVSITGEKIDKDVLDVTNCFSMMERDPCLHTGACDCYCKLCGGGNWIKPWSMIGYDMCTLYDSVCWDCSRLVKKRAYSISEISYDGVNMMRVRRTLWKISGEELSLIVLSLRIRKQNRHLFRELAPSIPIRNPHRIDSGFEQFSRSRAASAMMSNIRGEIKDRNREKEVDFDMYRDWDDSMHYIVKNAMGTKPHGAAGRDCKMHTFIHAYINRLMTIHYRIPGTSVDYCDVCGGDYNALLVFIRRSVEANKGSGLPNLMDAGECDEKELWKVYGINESCSEKNYYKADDRQDIMMELIYPKVEKGEEEDEEEEQYPEKWMKAMEERKVEEELSEPYDPTYDDFFAEHDYELEETDSDEGEEDAQRDADTVA